LQGEAVNITMLSTRPLPVAASESWSLHGKYLL